MFNFFHKNKFSYNKGQMLPVFILILTVVITMAMVTINIGKIGLIKTDSSNAADAGGLAAGATMSNTFNSIAVANSQLEAGYWEFFAEMSTMFATTATLIVSVQTNAAAALSSAEEALDPANEAADSAVEALDTLDENDCETGDPCSALAPAKAAAASMGTADAAMAAAVGKMGLATAAVAGVITTLISMIVSVISFATAQNFFYLSIRKMAEEGRKNAIRTGHQYLFNNSGITSKLNRNRQREFSMFMRYSVKYDPSYNYNWTDGQGREHRVESRIEIRPVDKFKLQVSVMPLPAEIAVLSAALVKAFAIQGALAPALKSYSAAAAAYTAAVGSYTAAVTTIDTACLLSKACQIDPTGVSCALCEGARAAAIAKLEAGFKSNLGGIPPNEAGITANNAALIAIPPLYTVLLAAQGSAVAGLAPGPSFTSFSDSDGLIFIINWIEDIIHDRLVRASTRQTHGGGNLTLWNTRYPSVQSYSVVNFNDENQGAIHPPDPRHDSSIIWTDIYLPEINPQADYCREVTGKVEVLTEVLQTLQGSSSQLGDNVNNDINNQTQVLTNDAANLTNGYNDLNSGLNSSMEDFRSKLMQWMQSGNKSVKEMMMQILMDLVNQLLSYNDGMGLMGGLSQQVNGETNNQVNTINDSAGTIREHIEQVQQPEEARIQQEIDTYIQSYPQCFPSGANGG